MKTNDIKKGTKIKTNHLGVKVSGIMLDSLKGNTRLIEIKGSEVGLFDEAGSVYATNIVEAKIEGEWVKVVHTENQLHAQKTREALGF